MSNIDINASIVDQQIEGLLKEYPHIFEKDSDISKKKALAFVLLCIKTSLNLSIEESEELLTDGGNDFGVDGLHVGDEEDGEFTVTLFQGKYKVKDLSGEANFPENGVKAAIATVQALFDPYKEITLNEKLLPRIEEIRSLVREGLIPNIHFVLCNNGASWTDAAEQHIDNARLPQEQVCFSHYNHDDIVDFLRSRKKINDSITLKGKAIIENFNYKRVLVGKVPVVQIAALFDKYDDLLLERNIRRYLGLHSNRVNTAISNILCSDAKRDNFYFFNNGITVICEQFRYNALQGEDYTIQLTGMQIINGGQTCKTIQQTIADNPHLISKLENAFVMIRIYEMDSNSEDVVGDITFATNSQNPVDLRELHANDDIQQKMELGLREFGYTYRRKREESVSGATVIHSSVVAESVLAILRQCPHQARFMRREHFGKLYSTIFTGLNAAQALISVHIFRFVDSERKTPKLVNYAFLPYSVHYIAMRIGCLLLKGIHIESTEISHRNYNEIMDYWEHNKAELYIKASRDINQILTEFYGGRTDLSLQLLSATFRRGDLIEQLRRC